MRKPLWAKTSLLQKQLILSLVIGFLPYCILNFYFAIFLQKNSESEQMVSTRQYLLSVSQSVDGVMQNYREMSHWIIGDEAIRRWLNVPEYADLDTYNNAYNIAIRELLLLPHSSKVYTGIAIFRNDGRQMSYGPTHVDGFTEEQKAKATMLNGSWFWNVADNKLSLCRLYRDKEQLSHHMGYLKFVLVPERIGDAFRPLPSVSSVAFALLSDDGDWLYSSFPDIFSQEELSSASAQLIKDPAQSVFLSSGQFRYMLMLSPVPEGKLSVLALREIDYSSFITYRNGFLLTSLFAAAIIIMLQVYLTNRWIINPLYKLATLMRSIEREDYSVRFHVKSNDEISYVANQFNHMSDRLQSLYEEVYQSKLKASEAEIQALQAEINPHFMFNTLDNIYWMVNMGDQNGAMEMIRALSESFRISLYRSKYGFVSLKMAVDQVRYYMAIQKLRLRENISYDLDVDTALDQEDVRVLHLVLQPLVENAVVHGLAPDGGGEVLVSVTLSGKIIKYSVWDSGSHADPEKIRRALSEPPEGNHGLALYNIQTRIQLKYGPAYGIEFFTPEDGGALFVVTQPLLTAKEVEALEADDRR